MFTRALAFLAATVLSLSALAAGPEAFEGHEYARLKNPQPVATGSKVEVLEFFWYRCPHCFQLEPGLNAWLKTLPRDAQVRRVPAVFRDDWMPGAKLYYTLEQMNLLDRLHHKVFDAYHVENINLNDPGVLGGWIAKQGVDRKKFQGIYNSFSTQSKATQGAQLATAYAISGVPAFIIDGKYTTSVSMAGSQARLFEVLDQLIVKARAERGSKKSAK
ncbi:MAG TPA: thiol:disulfide interchange protein DsbA/DsbL [Thiobacillus sp.]|nr:MAG: disulfide bond formation protein DsbA [Hydrogenophilales bacterium 16-64-40]OZA35189.1 MAG: disulfide bond formation protein DsbA [Hydrogenophilales bacterium 17-64-65]HQS83216.1 thiol:disulfide interchange protein DsbA/DsbL [Thiobacillus sp.]HQT32518.1 thiol:disulfide interchange protein DsbA/DsbL [Thiobacillus sp.]